jgi:hypothetical protein
MARGVPSLAAKQTKELSAVSWSASQQSRVMRGEVAVAMTASWYPRRPSTEPARLCPGLDRWRVR